MAAQVNAGKLRTKIFVFARPPNGERDPDGYPAVEPVNVFGAGKHRLCHWVNAHGREVYEAKQAEVTEPATLTLRYRPEITTVCTVYRESDPVPYEIISLDNVENRGVWLEVKVQRKAAAQ